MEGLSVAASVIAVVELSAKVASLCLQYSKDVKHAKDNIVRLRLQVTDLGYASASVQQLLDGPNGSSLKASQQLLVAIRDGESQLQELHKTLCPRNARQALSRQGLRSLKWPFQSKDIEKIVQDLGRCTQTISLALQVDQTGILLNIDQKMVLDRLPVAEGAFFDSHAEEHNPTCLPTTRVELLQQISEWADSPRPEAVFWLNGMAGTGKSTMSRTVAQSFAKAGQLGSSFFFKRGEGDRGSLSKFFTTIAADLVVREPAVAPHIKTVIDTNPAIITKNAREQFDKLILQPLSAISITAKKSTPLVVVIDALDECDREDEVKLLIDLISRTETLYCKRLRVFVTSRPELAIRSAFKAIEGKYQDIILHDVAELVCVAFLAIADLEALTSSYMRFYAFKREAKNHN
ncbi:hypothetical protein K4F52_001639 [Lecanicillium sp. MT-2017a]|nr:hypothetical protein K4F52_001639 [Lecanicillium sp. MT-2017a]